MFNVTALAAYTNSRRNAEKSMCVYSLGGQIKVHDTVCPRLGINEQMNED